MPCNPSELNLTQEPGQGPSAIKGFGIPFAPGFPSNILSIPDGFPEGLLELMDKLQLILPSGTIKPSLNPNFGKDIFDGIMKLMDQFFPFFMMYKFFMPILELIICIIEVICAINNPIKLIRAIKRLFRVCLPNFLSLFPIFALIMMLISLILLMLALIEYIINEILKLINLLLKNIRMISAAFGRQDEVSVLAAIKKIAFVLCAFQNLFVLLTLFKIIFDLIKDMLQVIYNIPPCDDGQGDDKCCSNDVCPDFIRNNETFVRTTGTLQYLNKVYGDIGDLRKESWYFYDTSALEQLAFINIKHPYDLIGSPSEGQSFFPNDATYSGTTNKNQAPYKVDLKLYYIPAVFGRTDSKGDRFIKINDCIVTVEPNTSLIGYDNNSSTINNGVLTISGGLAAELDGTPIDLGSGQANLDSFIHIDPSNIGSSITLPANQVVFPNVEYTFKINHEVLLQKGLITLGCIPTVALDRQFINQTFGGNAGVNAALLKDLITGSNFPDPGAAQNCLISALNTLRNDISESGVANFQAETTLCLNKLKDDSLSGLKSLIGIGMDNTTSVLSIDTNIQFTTKPIKVSVELKERNGQSIISKIPQSLGDELALNVVPSISFGEISQFKYDGNNLFVADLTSNKTGSGKISVNYDSKDLSTVIIPTDLTQTPSLELQELDYTFIYSPVGDTDGKTRKDESDVGGV